MSRDPCEVLSRIVALIPSTLNTKKLKNCLKWAAPEAAWQVIGIHCTRLFTDLDSQELPWHQRIIEFLQNKDDGKENDVKFKNVAVAMPQEEKNDGVVMASSTDVELE